HQNMRIGVMIVALSSAVGLYGCSHTNARPTVLSGQSNFSTAKPTDSRPNLTGDSARVDFAKQVRPILEAKCQPCHFNGGKVYSQMPFDRPETIKRLGTKLFTRIKEENERQVIRTFIAQE
ncbi:MAG: hypothetical protein M3R69_19360, partial [Acidobacteriota bacterium]|nr:hypothetical protein [Acidobacteriota bacterium]